MSKMRWPDRTRDFPGKPVVTTTVAPVPYTPDLDRARNRVLYGFMPSNTAK